MNFENIKTVKDFDLGLGVDMDKMTRVVAELERGDKGLQGDMKLIIWLLLEKHGEDYEAAGGATSSSEDEPDSKRRTTNKVLGSSSEEEGDQRAQHSFQWGGGLNYKRPRDSDQDFRESVLRFLNINVPFEELTRDEKDALLKQFSVSCDLLAKEKFTNILGLYETLRKLHTKVNDFRKTSYVGEGKYGKVFAVEYKKKDAQLPDTYKFYALKEIKLSLEKVDRIRMILNESSVLKKLVGNPRVVQYYDSWLDMDTDNSLVFHLQMELCEKSLHQWKLSLRDWKPDEAKCMLVMVQVLEALQWIHSKQCLHLDINPKNIFWSNKNYDSVKVGDFGLAVQELSVQGRRGTPMYVAPENVLTPKSDIYSLGVTICAQMYSTEQEIAHRIKHLDFDISIKSLVTLIPRMLSKDPNDRPTAEEALRTLQEFRDN